MTEYEAGLRKIIKYLRRRGGFVGSNSTTTTTSTESSGNDALLSGRVRLLLLTPPPVDEVGWGGEVCLCWMDRCRWRLPHTRSI